MVLKNIPVVILCGGKGTRLKEVTEIIPKPMVEIGDKPILWHIMNTYYQYGFKKFIICLGYKGSKIKEYFLNYDVLENDFTIKLGSGNQIHYLDKVQPMDWEITMVNTGEDNMTGSRIKQIEKYIDSDCFMVTYGDGLCNVNLDELVQHHLEHKRIGTVTGVRPPSRFGQINIHNGMALSFTEKPQSAEGRINGGFFIFHKDFFKYLSANPECVLEREPLERLAEDGQLMVHEHDGFWQCMDTLRDMHYLQQLYQQGNVPWLMRESNKNYEKVT